MAEIVDLDASLKDVQPWAEVAETLREEMRHAVYDGVTITLRAMRSEDWRLIDSDEELEDLEDSADDPSGRR